MATLTSVVKFFPRPAENSVTMTLGGSISSGATTVPVNGMSNYSDGDVVCFTVDPGTPAVKQAFTGTKSGTNVVNVVWTEGTNQAHSSGASVIDYVSATHVGIMSIGILKQHNQDGTHGAITATSLSTSANASVGGTLGVTGTATHSGATVLTGDVSGAGFTPKNLSNPYKFHGYRNAAMTSTGSVITFDTEDFDTNNNFDTVTNKGRYTAPINGFYHFDTAVMASVGVSSHYILELYKNGSAYKRLYEYTASATTNFTFTSGTTIQLTAGDYVEIFFSPPGVTTIFVGGSGLYTWFSGFLVSAT